MTFEEKIKLKLLTRGFGNNTLVDNRGLIGATIDETILELVKNDVFKEISGTARQDLGKG